MPITYVPRAFGGTLVINTSAHTTTHDLATRLNLYDNRETFSILVTRDGTGTLQTRDGVGTLQTRDGTGTIITR